MTTTETRNEAAFRLRAHLDRARIGWLDEALATERRNVVEQVRDYLAIIEENAREHPRQMVEVTLKAWLGFWRNLDLDSIATGTEEEGKP